MTLITDLRLALRHLITAPGFTVLSIITLGLGIGANTAMFSSFNGIVLKPLPYPDSAQLDRIYRSTPQNPEGSVSPADFLDLQQQMDAYGTIAAYAVGDASLSEPAQPAEMAATSRVTANFFSTLGVQPQLGRDFRPADDIDGSHHVLILSQRYWQNRFGGSADIIGRVVRVDGEPHEIVGVLAATFNDSRHLGSIDLIRPLGLDNEQSADRRGTNLRLIGRRSGTRSRAESEEFIVNFGARLASEFADTSAGSTWRTVPLNDTILRAAPLMISMVIGLSGFVVLIACSNLTNLLQARTMARAREFAVRSALGASRTRLLRPLVAESVCWRSPVASAPSSSRAGS